ncbi:MAG: LysR family transcriptional regulator [Pigmentiphaga sp.]|uniref:LysR family transcriptional regulator n=1 Tax=Pigmentiphaga sp. TaxID=1977564 RepID=UPI0029BF7A46|nr:LysR family transcriptional regulator [Pigmentiphaga sp.]MDX3905238.1 LysR family transcriptional regulator [Pigmentiphaga sp.]
MDFKQLEHFVRVAEHGSFSRAAAALGVGQPFLSRQIRQLEVELRKTLFHRHGRGIALTDAGEQFCLFARSVLQQFDAATQVLSRSETEITGRVVVGMPPSLGRVLTVPLVRAFSERFPLARLTIVEALSMTLYERLISDKLDAALMYDPSVSTLTEIEPIVREPLCLILRKTEESGDSKPLAFSHLAEHRLIFPTEPHPLRTLVETEATRQGIALDIAFEIDGVEAIVALVDKGFGAAVVPYNLVRAGMQSTELRICPLVEPVIAASIGLVTHSRRPPTLLTTKTVDLLRQTAADTLVGSEPID